jgi:hypothetical protein
MELADSSTSTGAIIGQVDLSNLPQEETPTGTKVPEPATLGLMGTGLIAIARVLRMIKRPQRTSVRLAGATITCIAPRESSAVL